MPWIGTIAVRFTLLAAFAIGLFADISASSAADITFEGDVKTSVGIREARFHLRGEITSADVGNVKAALAKAGVSYEQDPWRQIIVTLDSAGGSYHAGLDLALLFRRLGLATEVRGGERCYSACAIAFLGGTNPPKDPTPLDDNSPLPDQLPNRSIAAGSQLGFHAPYLDVPASSYTAQNVEKAYRSAVMAIARLIAVADRLYVSPAELPWLLRPARDEAFMVDTVDAVRFLGVDYTDRSLQFRYVQGITPSMIRNACINRYYHLQRRSSLLGFATAVAVRDEFIEGSKLLGNGEENLAFGVRRIKSGAASTWVAFAPIAKTASDTNFVWCIFRAGSDSATIVYKAAGTVGELFKEVEGTNALDSFWSSQSTMKIGTDFGLEGMMRVLDMVPPNTKLTDVASKIQLYLKEEQVVRPN